MDYKIEEWLSDLEEQKLILFKDFILKTLYLYITKYFLLWGFIISTNK